jgi:hypothetical protein|tara:strand:+ start:800 stop:1108 length:309 start_codon:yes stop_codon:yes gene_type:complete
MDNFNIHSFYKKQYLAEALADNVDKIQISYTDPGFRFYGMYLTKDGKRDKISFEKEATEYLNDLGIDIQMPRTYEEDKLDKIVDELKRLGIKASHDAAMDTT